MNYKNTKWYAGMTLSALMVGACASTDKSMTSLDPKSEEVISQLQKDLKQRRAKGQHLISPDQFDSAEDHAEEALELAQDGETYEIVMKEVKKSKKHLSRVDKNFEQGTFHLSEILELRAEALKEGASPLESFQDAEDELADLGESIEENDINEVLDEKDEVAAMFKDAEIEAIQNRELFLASENLRKARESSNIDAFEGLENRTVKQMKTAKRLISQNKDDYSRFTPAVEEATKSSDVLLARTKTADWLKNTPTRELVRTLETDLEQIGNELETGSLVRNSYPQKMMLIKNQVALVPMMRDQLTDAQMAALNKDSRLNEMKKQKQQLATRVERQKELREKLQFVRDQFSENEAEILLKGDDLVVRLVGLNFGVNKATLPENAKPILTRVAKAINQFESPEVEIQGHTDFTGDADYNRRLSEQRAITVKQFLNEKVTDTDLETIGFGFSRPVADNKSQMGRTKNRRIDVVIESVVSDKI